MNHSIKDFPGNHELVSHELSKIIPVDFPDKASDTDCEFLSKVLPVNSCNQKIQGVYQSIDAGTNCTPHQVPVDVIYQAIKCPGKCITELRYLWSYVIPVDDIIDFLKSFVDSTGYVSSKAFPIFVFDQFSDLICNPFQGTFNRNFLKHIFRRRTCIFSI